MNVNPRASRFVALLTLLIAAGVYLRTLTPTVPFWDSGEFIAVSNILGIPHPPGTPFFVLLGRVATLIPWATIAQRVNAVSAISAALAVLLTYLCTLSMARRAFGEDRKPWQEWAAIAGAFVGALMLAFSDNFWENSIEAEVYQMMSLASVLVFWLGLKWWDAHDKKPNVGFLLAATYVMWLSVGLHLGVGVMGAPLIVLVAFIDWKVAMLFAIPFLAILRVPAGLEKMAGAVLLFSVIVNFWFLSKNKMQGWVFGISALLAAYGMYFAYGKADFTAVGAIAAAVGVVFPLVMMAPKHKEARVILLALLLMVVGYSTHLYLPIRANLHPAINEGNPSNWNTLRDLLERKQYGEMNMFVRRSSLENQLNKEFWRYFSRQWPLFPGKAAFTSLLPMLLGLAGAFWQAKRDPKKGFFYNFVFFGLNTAGLIVFLNFSDHEVRDRDYFFQSGYHAYAMWIGLGCTWLICWVRESFSEGAGQRYATVAATVLLCAQPFLLMKTLWFTHDRSGNYIARDYAYNMLAPLAPNSYMFTNGDNDTFPLWYIQQVEGFRKDVRIVNLSLLNTDWYIRQLRDESPKVPITLDDRTVQMLGGGAVQDETGHIIYTNEYMVHHIMENSKNADGTWKRQPYFAVTVPEHYGYDPYFALQGLVYEVKRDSLKAGLDVPATTKALYETFMYRGLFEKDGTWDRKVYKDDNASTLSRNYAAAHLQLAYYYRRNGQLPKAISEMERIGRMFPDYAEVLLPLGGFYMDAGDTAKAMALFEMLNTKSPNNPEVKYYYGVSMALRGKLDEAVRQFDAAIQMDPNYGLPYYGAYSTLREAGQRERALQYLQRWLEGHPGDPQAQQLLDSERNALGIRSPSRPSIVPPPVTPVP